MRIGIYLLTVLLLLGCGSKKPAFDEADIITKTGVITAKEVVSMDEVKRSSNTRTNVYFSVSSGGGVAVGIGVLLSPWMASKEIEPVRYEVKLNDGGEMTVYHESRDFEVDDCVKIRIYPDEEKNPPSMRRDRDACAS